MKIFQSFRTPAICLALLGLVGALTGCAGMAELFGPQSPAPEQRRVVYYPQPAPAPTPAAAPVPPPAAPQVASTPAAPAAPATTPAAAPVISQSPGEATTPPANAAALPAPTSGVVYIPWPNSPPTNPNAAADAGVAALQSLLMTLGPWGAVGAAVLGTGAWWLRGRYWSSRDIEEAQTIRRPGTV